MLYLVFVLLLYDLSDCLEGRFQPVDDFVEAALLIIEERFSDSRTIDSVGRFLEAGFCRKRGSFSSVRRPNFVCIDRRRVGYSLSLF